MTAGLREVEEYELPESVPERRVSWTADPARAALLVHDMQVYFLNAFSVAPRLRQRLVENNHEVLAAARAAGMPVLFSAQPGDMSAQDRGLLVDLWGPGMRATVDERAIVEELAPEPGESVITKWRYSAFHRSPLLDRLRSAGRDQLVITGVYTHLGVVATAMDAYANDVQTFVVADATATFSAAVHLQALEFAASSCARVSLTDELVREIRG